MVLLESPILKKAHLLGLGFEVGRLSVPEFSPSDIARQTVPIGSALLDRHFDYGVTDTALAQVESNTNRALALIDAGLHKCPRESIVALQSLLCQPCDRLFDQASNIAFVGELLNQLGLAVLPTRKKIHRLFANFIRARKTIFLFVGEKIAYFFV